MGKYHSKKKWEGYDGASHDMTMQCGHMVEGTREGLPAKPLLNISAVTLVLTPGKRDKNQLSVNI